MAFPANPFCFDPVVFSEDAFDPHQFVNAQLAKASLEDLRQDLSAYSVKLRSQLIDLLNRDYGDFISLSSDLVGTSGSIGTIGTHLGVFRKRIAAAVACVDAQLQKSKDEITNKEHLQDKQQTLKQLQNYVQSTKNVKQLLSQLSQEAVSEKPSSPVTAFKRATVEALTGGTEDDTMLRQSSLLERIGRQMSQLSLLQRELSSFELVEDMVGFNRKAQREFEQVMSAQLVRTLQDGHRSALGGCLRAFGFSGQTELAEQIIAKQLVRPAIESIVTEARMHEISLQHTRKNGSGEQKQAESAVPTLLGVVKDILAFVQSRLRLLFECTGFALSGPESVPFQFDFLTNSVWTEIHAALTRHASILFAPGIADTFHENYTHCRHLILELESMCVSKSALMRFRRHPCTSDFNSRWNLSVYFGLRMQEVGIAVETELSHPGPPRRHNRDLSDGGPVFFVKGTHVVWEALMMMWQPNVFIRRLAHRFFKLSLQVLARFVQWVDWGLGIDGASPEARDEKQDPGAEASKPGWHPAALSTLLLLHHDLGVLEAVLSAEFIPFVSGLVSGQRNVDEAAMLVRQGVDPVLVTLRAHVPVVRRMIVSQLVRECGAPLQAVSKIKTRYSMTSRPAPSSPSAYVAQVVQPLRNMVAEYGEQSAVCAVPRAVSDAIVQATCSLVCRRYERIVVQLLEAVRKTEASLRSLKQYQNNDGADGPASTRAMSDVQKITLQLKLDVEEFTRLMNLLGVDCGLPDLVSVNQLVLGGTGAD